MPKKKKSKAKPKTEFLQIRVTPDQKYRITKVASAEFLDPSTWARAAILKAAEEAERYGGAVEPKKETSKETSAAGDS